MTGNEQAEHPLELVCSQVQGVCMAKEVAELPQLIQRFSNGFTEDGRANPGNGQGSDAQ